MEFKEILNKLGIFIEWSARFLYKYSFVSAFVLMFYNSILGIIIFILLLGGFFDIRLSSNEREEKKTNVKK